MWLTGTVVQWWLAGTVVQWWLAGTVVQWWLASTVVQWWLSGTVVHWWLSGTPAKAPGNMRGEGGEGEVINTLFASFAIPMWTNCFCCQKYIQVAG